MHSTQMCVKFETYIVQKMEVLVNYWWKCQFFSQWNRETIVYEKELYLCMAYFSFYTKKVYLHNQKAYRQFTPQTVHHLPFFQTIHPKTIHSSLGEYWHRHLPPAPPPHFFLFKTIRDVKGSNYMVYFHILAIVMRCSARYIQDFEGALTNRDALHHINKTYY